MENENEPRSFVTSSTLDFLQNNVYNITDLTRSNKLTEILEKFSSEMTEEVFIVQNAKNKDAKGVFLDLEFFQELLKYKEVFDQSLDTVLLEEADARKNEEATLSLTDIFDDDEIDFDQLLKEIGD